jgi:hypothetical protein
MKLVTKQRRGGILANTTLHTMIKLKFKIPCSVKVFFLRFNHINMCICGSNLKDLQTFILVYDTVFYTHALDQVIFVTRF